MANPAPFTEWKMAEQFLFITNLENNSKLPDSLQPYLRGFLVSKSVESNRELNQPNSMCSHTNYNPNQFTLI